MSNLIIKGIKYVFIILFLSLMTAISIPKSAIVCVNAEEIVDTLEIYYQYYSSEAETYVACENSEEFFNNVNSNSKIEVVYEFEYDYESNLMQNLSNELGKQEIMNLLFQHRQTSKEFFASKNNEFLHQNNFDLISNNYTLSVSHFAPYIVFTYNNLDCLQANFLNAINVDSTYLQTIFINEKKETISEATRQSSDNADIYPMAQVREDIGVYDNDFTGNGINIGMIEEGNPLNHSELNGKIIVTYPNAGNNTATNDDYEHATNVARTLVGSKSLAPNSNLYSSTIGQNDLIYALNVIMPYTQLINISYGYYEYSYNWRDAYLDFISRNHGITFVKSAGNYDSLDKPNYKITAPGLGYNVITVGNMNVNKKIDDTSCYIVNSSLNLRKPTVVAPGTWIETTWPGTNGKGRCGTSFAAPIVTGVIARLMEEFPILLGRPDMVQACIIASATPVNGQTEDSWDTHAGAGCINYERSRQAVQNAIMFENTDDLKNQNILATNEKSEINVVSTNQIKVVACWLANSMTYGQIANININIHTNYNIKIRNTNLESNHNSNVEVLWYTPTSNQVTIDIIQKEDMADENYYDDIGTVTWIYDDSPYITEVVDEGVAITGVTRPISGKAVIPSKIGEHPVVSVGNRALVDQTGINKVVISSNVKEIGNQAFENCVNLTNVTFLDNSQLTTIGDSAFKGSGITSISIPSTVTSISACAFENCVALTSIAIPNSVASIGLAAFLGCNNLEEISIPFVGRSANEYEQYTYFGYIFGTQFIEVNSIYVPTVLEKVIITGGSKIAANAFLNCSNIQNIVIPSTIEDISALAFKGCSGLQEITVSEDNEIFEGNGNYIIKNVQEEVSGETVQSKILVFMINGASIPNDVTDIGEYVFYEKSIISITLPETLRTIGDYAFYGTELNGIEFPSALTKIGANAFENCSEIGKIIIPSNITEIGANAFKNCSALEHVHILSGASLAIRDEVFSGCNSLTSIVIPSRVTRMGQKVFAGCILSIFVQSTKSNAFLGIKWAMNWNYYAMPVMWGCGLGQDNGVYYVSTFSKSGLSEIDNAVAGFTAPYREHHEFIHWYNDSFINEIIVTAEEIGDEDLPIGTYEAIWQEVSEGLQYTLTSDDDGNIGYEVSIGTATDEVIIIPSIYQGINVIGIGSFGERTDVIKVVIHGTNLKYIGANAFKNCSALQNITIPNGVEYIGEYAFYGCTSLNDLSLPISIEYIGEYAFAETSNMGSITIAGGVMNVEYNALEGTYGYTIYLDVDANIEELSLLSGIEYCIVFYNCNINDSGYVESITIDTYNIIYGTASSPYREGYEFIGWTTVEGGDEAEITMEYFVNNTFWPNTTLYAVWQEIT